MPPRSRISRIGLIVLALVGLTASMILLVDYAGGAPVFCDDGGGCSVVRQSAWASIHGVPMPVFGVLGFTAIALLALVDGRGSRRTLLGLVSTGAIIAVALVAVQHHLGAYCRYCLIADGTMLAAAALAWIERRALGAQPLHLRARALTGLALVMAVGVPLALGARHRTATVQRPGLPAVISREIATTPAGQLTIVEFVDFECPFCRVNDRALHKALVGRREHVRLVRKHVPLVRIHPHALAAARAACCGEALGHGDQLASLLFAAPPEQLTPEGCAALAASAGIDPQAYRDCLQSAAVDTRLRDDAAAFAAANGRGLPTLWINGHELVGAQTVEDLARVLDAARTGS